MIRQDLEKNKLPESPGVYFFLDSPRQGLGAKGNGKILYIGKATSLRDRVRSYFAPDVIKTRGPHIVDMVFKAKKIQWQETPSVLEALILEANLIKKHKPYYNTKEKDDKSFFYICITKEPFPIIFLERGRNLDLKNLKTKNQKLTALFGPYPSGPLVKEALTIIRRIFSFRDRASSQKDKEIFYRQIGLSPDVSSLEAGRQYRKNIGRIKMILQGKMQFLIKQLKKEMNLLAKSEKFEEANILKKKIFSLEHIQDVSLIKRDTAHTSHSRILKNMRMNDFRIEAYDVAHISGQSMVGVMTVVDGEVADKDEYRKFIIKGFKKANDAGALRQMLVRRLAHPEWSYPQTIVVDGNIIQKNVAQAILRDLGLEVPVIAVTKDEHHRPKSMIGPKKLIEDHKYAILLANSEAHRFALSFHRARRKKAML